MSHPLGIFFTPRRSITAIISVAFGLWDQLNSPGWHSSSVSQDQGGGQRLGHRAGERGWALDAIKASSHSQSSCPFKPPPQLFGSWHSGRECPPCRPCQGRPLQCQLKRFYPPAVANLGKGAHKLTFRLRFARRHRTNEEVGERFGVHTPGT